MTDPIKALIAAAQLLQEMWDNADRWTGPKASSHYRSAIHERMRAVFAAAEARPEPAPDESGDFYAQLPKGPTHGRFSASDRADLDNLKRKAFGEARPEPVPDPAAEPSIIPALRKVAAVNSGGDTRRALTLLCDAVEALAREVRK